MAMTQGVHCRICDEPLLIPPTGFPPTEFWPMPEHFWHLLDKARAVHTAVTGHVPYSIQGMSFSGGFEEWPPEYRPQGYIEVPLRDDTEA